MDPSRYYHLSIFLCKTAAFDSGSSISWSVTDGLARLDEVRYVILLNYLSSNRFPRSSGVRRLPRLGVLPLVCLSMGLLPQESFRAISTARLNTLP